MAAVTRLGLYGAARGPYGSFSGKTAFAGTKVYTKTFTRQGLYSGPRIPYGAFSGKTATVTVVATAAAGRSRRRRLYYVEVDGQDFVFSTVQAAADFLAEVRETAQEAAERSVEARETPTVPRITVKTATGKPTQAKTIQRELKKTRNAVQKTYERAIKRLEKQREVEREISTLIHKKIEREDDERIIMLLL